MLAMSMSKRCGNYWSQSMPNKKAKNRKREKMLKRKSIAEYKAKKRRERKDARRSAETD